MQMNKPMQLSAFQKLLMLRASCIANIHGLPGCLYRLCKDSLLLFNLVYKLEATHANCLVVNI